MKVTVRLTGGIAHTSGFSRKDLDVEPGTTIADVLAAAAVDTARPVIIARNGVAVDASVQVEPGDSILVAPPFSGG